MWVVLGLGESAAGGAGINLQGDLLVCVGVYLALFDQ